MVTILDLSHPFVWLVRHVCSDKAEFSFLQKKTAFWCSFKRVPNWRLVLCSRMFLRVSKRENAWNLIERFNKRTTRLGMGTQSLLLHTKSVPRYSQALVMLKSRQWPRTIFIHNLLENFMCIWNIPFKKQLKRAVMPVTKWFFVFSTYSLRLHVKTLLFSLSFRASMALCDRRRTNPSLEHIAPTRRISNQSLEANKYTLKKKTINWPKGPLYSKSYRAKC